MAIRIVSGVTAHLARLAGKLRQLQVKGVDVAIVDAASDEQSVVPGGIRERASQGVRSCRGEIKDLFELRADSANTHHSIAAAVEIEIDAVSRPSRVVGTMIGQLRPVLRYKIKQ